MRASISTSALALLGLLTLLTAPTDARAGECKETFAKGAIALVGSFAHNLGCKFWAVKVGDKEFKNYKRAAAAAMRHLKWTASSPAERGKLAKLWTFGVLARLDRYSVVYAPYDKGTKLDKLFFKPRVTATRRGGVQLEFWRTSSGSGMRRRTERTYTSTRVSFDALGRLVAFKSRRKVTVPVK